MNLTELKHAAMAVVRDTARSRYSALSTAELIHNARGRRAVVEALEMLREFEIEEEFAIYADSVSCLVETSDPAPTPSRVDSSRIRTPESRPMHRATLGTQPLER